METGDKCHAHPRTRLLVRKFCPENCLDAAARFCLLSVGGCFHRAVQGLSFCPSLLSVPRDPVIPHPSPTEPIAPSHCPAQSPVRPPGGANCSQLFSSSPCGPAWPPHPTLASSLCPSCPGWDTPHRVFFSQRPGYSSALSPCAAYPGLAVVRFWTPRLRCSLGLWTPSEHLVGILALGARVWGRGRRVLSCSGQEGGASGRWILAPPISHPLTCFLFWKMTRIKRAHWL